MLDFIRYQFCGMVFVLTHAVLKVDIPIFSKEMLTWRISTIGTT